KPSRGVGRDLMGIDAAKKLCRRGSGKRGGGLGDCRAASCWARQQEACRSAAFGDAMLAAFAGSMLPEARDEGAARTARGALLRAFNFGGDTVVCWLSGEGAETCCRVGCAAGGAPEVGGPCCTTQRVGARAPRATSCAARCVAARSLLPVWPSIASWRRHSQVYQDAVVSFLVAQLGARSRYFVEIGFNQPDWGADSSGPNTKILHEAGWQGIMLDNTFENPGIGLYKHEVTMENVASLFELHGVPTEPDYVSIDIDGCDLWVFLGLTEKFRPRIVSIEYNANWPVGNFSTVDCVGARRAQGKADTAIGPFRCLPSELGPGTYENFCGASLSAIALAAELRGYSVVWASAPFDAFLVRGDLICHGEKIGITDISHLTGSTVHSPPADKSRPEKWLVDFSSVAHKYK
ncbi:unnamed protein product, partial [Prorocentrum cordatum]